MNNYYKVKPNNVHLSRQLLIWV